MSGGRFLASFTEVIISESIISWQALLKDDLDFAELEFDP